MVNAIATSKNDEKFSDYVAHELLLYVQAADFSDKDPIIESLRKAANLTQLPAVLSNPDRSDVKRCAWYMII